MIHLNHRGDCRQAKIILASTSMNGASETILSMSIAFDLTVSLPWRFVLKNAGYKVSKRLIHHAHIVLHTLGSNNKYRSPN